MKILTVVGARPQLIKAAVVSRLLREAGVSEILVHTGQHYDPQMSDVFFSELGMNPPAHNLKIGSASHGAQTGRMLEALEQILFAEKPDTLLVYGDTNSTLAGALVAAKAHVRLAHVEAGLRSYNRRMPEELNRIVTDHVSDVLLTPSLAASENLRREGVPDKLIHCVGDIMLDASLYFAAQAREKSQVLARLGLEPRSFVLATIHRAENTDDINRLRVIFEALAEVSAKLPVVLPLHPRTKGKAGAAGILATLPATFQLIEPVGYLDMARLESEAAVIATDSGGVQKEAFFSRVPCVTLRDETEWTELVDLGWNRLVSPTSRETVARAVLAAVGKRGRTGTPFGDGNAGERIVQILRQA